MNLKMEKVILEILLIFPRWYNICKSNIDKLI